LSELSEELAASIVRMMTNHPDDGGSKLLRKVYQYLPDYTVQHPRR
jgi:hypothetical protein